MPHVIVKLQSGRSEQQKTNLAQEITKAIMAGASSAEESVSVSIEDVEPDAWSKKSTNGTLWENGINYTKNLDIILCRPPPV